MENKISIFEYLKDNENEKLFIKSVYFKKFLKILVKKYNSFIENDKEEEYSLFLINKKSSPDFVAVRFFILVKKYIGIDSLKEIYKEYIRELLFIRDFLINNKIDETEETDFLLKEIKKKKNTELLTPGNFKTEEVLFSKLEKEYDVNDEIFLEQDIIQNKGIKQEESKKNNKLTEEKNTGKKIENEKKDFEIKNKEIVIYDNKGKILKRCESYITVSEKKVLYIQDYIEESGKFYYLGKYNFGEKIELSNKFLKENSFFKDILLKLIKKIKGE
jgi:hypothetical protein